MKKLSILCIFAILCAIFSSCADPTDFLLGNPAETSADGTIASMTPAGNSTANTVSSSIEEGDILPDIDPPEIIYDWNDFELGLMGYINMDVLERYFDACEEYHIPFMFCMVTFTDIDYTQIGDEYSKLPITVSIDKIFQKTLCTSLNEGDSVTLQQSSCNWKKSGDAYMVRYHDYYFPIAEQGKRYLAIISEAEKPTEEYPLGISAISVPLPEGDEIRDEYFEEWYQKLNLHELLVLFAPQALDEWFYPYLESE